MSYVEGLAQRAFEAFAVSLYGSVPFAWATLSDRERAAWRAAVRAILGNEG